MILDTLLALNMFGLGFCGAWLVYVPKTNDK